MPSRGGCALTERADVVVVGGGGAGLAAAIEASRRGMAVTVLDSADRLGGTANGGGTLIAGSPLQARLGIVDSIDRALEDWLAFGGEMVDVDWARRYVEDSVPEIYDWLMGLGVVWEGVRQTEGDRVPRWHAPRGGGPGVTRALEGALNERAGVRCHLRTRFTDVLLAGGRVVGVAAEGPAGPFEIHAPAVVVASGGFSSNAEMVRRHATGIPAGARILLGGGYGALGQGHDILERTGAKLVNLGAVFMYPYGTPDYVEPETERGLACRDIKGEIWVNRQARRFHDEARRGGKAGTAALLAQEGAVCWSVSDGRGLADFTAAHPRYRDGTTPRRDLLTRLLAESPWVARGDTIEEVARSAGLDPGTLRETVREHNRAIALGLERDPLFGRPLAGLEPIAEPPFFAIEFRPLARKNLGGVRTDLECRVLATDGHPIAGLYAAGEVAGMAGGRINGLAALEGTMFGPSIFSGRIAGRSIPRS